MGEKKIPARWFTNPTKLVLLIGLFILIRYCLSAVVAIVTSAFTHSSFMGLITDTVFSSIWCGVTILLFRYIRCFQIMYCRAQNTFDWKTGAVFWVCLVFGVFLLLGTDVTLEMPIVNICLTTVITITDCIDLILLVMLLLNAVSNHIEMNFFGFLGILGLFLLPHLIINVLNSLYLSLNTKSTVNYMKIFIDTAIVFMLYTITFFFCLKHRNQFLRVFAKILFVIPFADIVMDTLVFTLFRQQLQHMRYMFGVMALVAALAFLLLIYMELKIRNKKRGEKDAAAEPISVDSSSGI